MNQFASVLGAWRGGEGPLHARLSAAIEAAVERAELGIGTTLPAERTMADVLTVSRGTVVAAMRTLADGGIIRRRRGSGSIVIARVSRPSRVANDHLRQTRLAQVYDKLELGVIEMVAAAPLGAGAVPDTAWHAALEQMSGLEASTGYFYAQGLPALRSAIADHMTGWGIAADGDEVAICSGAQQAISVVVDTLVSRGDHVIVEEYTWAGAIDALRAAGARIVTIPSDGAGPDVPRLREALANTHPSLVYLCPTVNNPTGVTMSVTRRMRIVEACRPYGMPVVDDCANNDVVVGERPPPLATFDPSAPVITVGSISKLFWGGLRVGWMHAPKDLLARLAERRRVADLGSPLITQLVATELLTHHVEAMRERRLAEISARRELVTQLVERELPWSWTEPSGGYMLWLRLPDGDSREFAHYALREGVAVLPGTIVSASGGGSDHLRLALIHDDPTTIEAFARLGRAWRTYAPLAARSRARPGSIVV